MNTKVMLDIAICDLCTTILGWECKEDYYHVNGQILEWSDFESIELPNKISVQNDNIDAILFFGDGTCEFHLENECDAINWGEFDDKTLKSVIKELNLILDKQNKGCYEK